MSYVIENIIDRSIVAKEIESLSAAILLAARYDGHGAEWARDSEGRMGLRTSGKHIGNNSWLATGDEPPVCGHTSDDEDDDDAIEVVVELINKSAWGGNMRNLRVVDQAELVRERLQLALDAYTGEVGPGEWLEPEAFEQGAIKYDGCALLCYRWPDGMTEDDPHWGDYDAPWKKWGGEAMVAAAGGRIRDGYGIDGIDHAVVKLA